MCPYRQTNKHLPTIRKIPNDLWNEIKLLLPPEKSDKTIGRPAIPFRKVDGIAYILRTGCQWKMLPKEYGSGSRYHRRVQLPALMDISTAGSCQSDPNVQGLSWIPGSLELYTSNVQ